MTYIDVPLGTQAYVQFGSSSFNISIDFQYLYSDTRIFGARLHRANVRPTFFPHTTRNIKILLFHHIANIFLRKLHRNIFNDLLSESLSSLLGFLSNVVVRCRISAFYRVRPTHRTI